MALDRIEGDRGFPVPDRDQFESLAKLIKLRQLLFVQVLSRNSGVMRPPLAQWRLFFISCCHDLIEPVEWNLVFDILLAVTITTTRRLGD